jgi:hypothetical protein
MVNGQEFPWLDGSIANLQALPRCSAGDDITTRDELLAAAEPEDRPFLTKIKPDLMACMLQAENTDGSPGLCWSANPISSST